MGHKLGKELTPEELQQRQLVLLEELDRVCRENGLRYSLSGGSLLGAVRHKGFIPWDDDVDVFLPRPDYDRFIEIYNAKAKGSYAMSYDTEPTYYRIFTRIYDEQTVLVQRGLKLGGVFIDVFAVDGQPSDYDEFLAYCKKTKELKKKIRWSTNYLKNAVNPFFKTLLFLISGHRPAKRAASIKELEALLRSYPLEKSEYAGCIIGGSGVGTHIAASTFDEYTDYPFEHLTVRGIKDYDTYLKKMYGDYMTPPPLKDALREQKKHHNAHFYWK